MLDFDNLFNFDDLFNSFDWDKKNYRFNRDEKDMHPYSIINKETEVIIVHNILGINKKDLKVSLTKENGSTYILIEGETKDELTEKKYSINSRFFINADKLDIKNITSVTKDGLLYITIPLKLEVQAKPMKKEFKKEEKSEKIDILIK